MYNCTLDGRKVVFEGNCHQVPLAIIRVEGKEGEVLLNQHSVTQVDYSAFSQF